MTNGKALAVGQEVYWTECDIDIPPGTVGTVLGFRADDAVRVQFPKGRWVFPAGALETDAESVDKGCLGKIKALPGELKTKLYLGCPLVAMVMVLYTLALYVLDFYSDILLVFEVLPIMKIIYPSAMTVPVFSKSLPIQEYHIEKNGGVEAVSRTGRYNGIDVRFQPTYFGMAHTGTRRGERLPPVDTMEDLGKMPHFAGVKWRKDENTDEGPAWENGRSCDGTQYPSPNFLQKTARYDLFMTTSAKDVYPFGAKLLMYWDRENNYGAKCYGLEYGREPILMDPHDGFMGEIPIAKADYSIDSCPEDPVSIIANRTGGLGEYRRHVRRGDPPYDPTWPNPEVNLRVCTEEERSDPYSACSRTYNGNYTHNGGNLAGDVNIWLRRFHAEESDYANMHCQNTMTTLPLSENPDCEVWDPELCMCPTDRSHLFGQTSLDPKHGHLLPKPWDYGPEGSFRNCRIPPEDHGTAYYDSDCDPQTLTMSDYPERESDPSRLKLRKASCKCLGVTDADGEGGDCLDFTQVDAGTIESKGLAWCYTAEGRQH